MPKIRVKQTNSRSFSGKGLAKIFSKKSTVELLSNYERNLVEYKELAQKTTEHDEFLRYRILDLLKLQKKELAQRNVLVEIFN